MNEKTNWAYVTGMFNPKNQTGSYAFVIFDNEGHKTTKIEPVSLEEKGDKDLMAELLGVMDCLHTAYYDIDLARLMIYHEHEEPKRLFYGELIPRNEIEKRFVKCLDRYYRVISDFFFDLKKIESGTFSKDKIQNTNDICSLDFQFQELEYNKY